MFKAKSAGQRATHAQEDIAMDSDEEEKVPVNEHLNPREQYQPKDSQIPRI